QAKFFDEDYEMELNEFFNSPYAVVPENFFNLIYQHLFNFTYSAIRDLQRYINFKIVNDTSRKAAEKILAHTVQLVPINSYRNYDALSAVANYVNEIVS